jgi:hypothetical protein
MLRRVALVRTDFSEQEFVSIIKLTRIGDLGTTLLLLLITTNVIPSSPIHVTLIMEGMHFYEMSVLTKTTLRNIKEDGIIPIQHRENLYLSCYFDVEVYAWKEMFRLPVTLLC